MSNRWLQLSPDQKQKIKQDVVMTLASPQAKAGIFAAQVTAAVAAVEIPQGQWPELIDMLLGFVNQTNTNLKIATLQTIGYICEQVVRFLVQRSQYFHLSYRVLPRNLIT